MNIGLLGRARSGKDTAGKWLVERRGYERVAFADPLKEAALKLDPLVRAGSWSRLSDVVAVEGWEYAKDDYPEVRRVLQHIGQSIRDLDPDFWLRQTLKAVDDVEERFGRPVVITDVRYPNEVAALRERGFRLAYIDRPGVPQLDHASERLTSDDAEFLIPNWSSVAALHHHVGRMWDDVHERESRRHEARIY
ncbi:hypothetical protein AB0A77_02075 [Streptomyces varsoviensis]|uniref:deoxynucleotide monophosphate kinase family protein n=1 Tax=Streptomyces varsoviensis TaxID=67373 RepID=UPI0033EA6BE4